jgi:hypothetical protein
VSGSALGILLAAFYGPIGPLGALLSRFGVIITNDPPALLIAGIYAGLPTYVVAARPAFAEISPDLAESALTLGVNRRQIFWFITLPMARGRPGAPPPPAGQEPHYARPPEVHVAGQHRGHVWWRDCGSESQVLDRRSVEQV